jgi:hypothetical protein
MPRKAGFLVGSMVLVLGAGAGAKANFIVSFPSSTVTIQAGNTTPTTIVASIAGTSSDVVNQFQLTFLITRDPSNPLTPAAFPQFVNPSASSDPTFSDLKYIFTGDSLSTGSAFGVASNPGTGFNTRFVGGDETLSGSDVTVTAANNHLANLLVNSTVSTTTNPAGDRYILTLDLANSQFYHGNHVQIPNTSITVNPGSILVTTSVATVAEPASLVSGLGAAIVVTGWWYAARRRVHCRGRAS